MPQLLSSISEFYLEAVGKLPGECVNVDMLLLRIPDLRPPPPPTPTPATSPRVSLGTSSLPGPFTLHRQLGAGINGTVLVLCHALVHARVLQAQLGEPQVPGQHFYPGLCRNARPGQGRGIRTPGVPAWALTAGRSGEGAAWTKPPCAVLSRASWIPGCRGSPARTHVGTWKPGG